jgi:hypothetical protein
VRGCTLDEVAVLGHDAASAAQLVHGLVDLPEVGGYGAEPGEGLAQLPGEFFQDFLSGLTQCDALLSGGDRGLPRFLLLRGAGRHGLRREQGRPGGHQGRADLGLEPGNGAEPVGDLVFGGAHGVQELNI